MVLTGLRGVGKTVLLEAFKPLAIQSGWLWVGTDLSESVSLTEENIAHRLITDLSVVTSTMTLSSKTVPAIGFGAASSKAILRLDYETLLLLFKSTPGLIADKLKAVLETVWAVLPKGSHRGIVFAYDEAQAT